MGIKFIVISVQVYHIVSYLDCFSKHTKENLKMQQVFVQGSINHTPEGTDTFLVKHRLSARSTSTKVYAATAKKVGIITPVESAGE